MKIAFFQHWTYLAVPLVRAMLLTGQDELLLVGSAIPPALRDRGLIDQARRQKVKVLAPENLLEAGFLSRLESFAPDLILVVTFPKKLPNPLLEMPALAAINLHPALLPAYRGACPEYWVIRNGESETGVTLHKMTERFDAGHILAQARIPLWPDDTMLSLTERMIQPSWELIVDLLDRYRNGERPEGHPQDPALVSKAPMVRPEHLQVRWSEPAVELDRLVRAAYPSFEPQCKFRSLQLTVLRTGLARDVDARLEPGELLLLEDRRLLVGTGEGLLELKELQLTYGPKLGGWEFCDSYGMASGERMPS